MTTNKIAADASWKELLTLTGYVPPNFWFPVDVDENGISEYGDYSIPERDANGNLPPRSMDPVDRLFRILRDTWISVGYDPESTPVKECLHRARHDIKDCLEKLGSMHQTEFRLYLVGNTSGEGGHTIQVARQALAWLMTIADFLAFESLGYLGKPVQDLPTVGIMGEINAMYTDSKAQFKKLEWALPKWEGTVASWMDFAVGVRSFMHGHGLGCLLQETACAIDLADPVMRKRAAYGWLDAQFFEQLRACITHQYSQQPRLDFVNECRWGYGPAKGSSLWMLLVGSFETTDLVEERATYFEHTLMKDRIKDSQNMDLDSLAANQAMVLASYVPLLRPATTIKPAEALKLCIQKYTTMFESNSVRSNMAAASTTNDIRSTRSKTSNRNKKDLFGSFQFSVGKPGHMKIRRTSSDNKKEWPLGKLQTKGATDTRKERSKTVTFKDDIRANEEDKPAPNRSLNIKVGGDKVEEKPEKIANSQQGADDKPNSKRKRGGKKSWKARQNGSDGSNKKQRVGSEDKQPEKAGIADGAKKSKKKKRRSKTRRMASAPGPANNYLDNFLPGSK